MPDSPPTVYFIQGTVTKKIKIGTTTTTPEYRLANLQTASAEDLVLLGSIPGGIDRERELHLAFEASHFRHEWFNPTDELLKFISDNCQSTETQGAVMAVRSLE